MAEIAAIIVAGGGARRMGGGLKPAVRVGGVPMLDRVVAALDGAAPIVVVGPETLPLGPRVRRVQEWPPGGGPVAGIGAAFAEVAASATVFVVAGDLPLFTAVAATRLHRAITGTDVGTDRTAADAEGASCVDGAVYVDGEGHAQWLCGIWWTEILAARLAAFEAERGGLADGSLRALLGPLRYARIRTREGDPPPYFDCDTEDDIKRAEEWLRR